MMMAKTYLTGARTRGHASMRLINLSSVVTGLLGLGIRVTDEQTY